MSDPLRELERDSLRRFVASCDFAGRVLDYGCGNQPYRDIVEATGAAYHGYEDPELPAHVAPDDPSTWLLAPLDEFWDVILCTQVIQYVADPLEFLLEILDALVPGGALVLTGPTTWPIVEPDDLCRYTPAGIRRLLTDAGFTVARLEDRATIPSPGGPLLLGWGAVATTRTEAL